MKAIVNVPICALLAASTRESTLEDEALYGMVVDILEEPAPGWYRVRTHYRYEGIVSADDLIVGDAAADAWAALPKKIIRNKNFCDVLSAPKVQAGSWPPFPGAHSLPGGSAGKGLAAGASGGWPNGLRPGKHPRRVPYRAPVSGRGNLRQALVDAAMLYQAPITAGAASLPWALTAPVWCPRPICSAAFLFTGTPISWRTFPFTKFLWKM